MRLGDIIERLDGAPQDAPIWYDFEAGVGEFYSWRGSYGDLTLAPTEDPSTVGDVLRRARQALTKTFYGYKGGDYEMNKNTPVWADEYGEAPRQDDPRHRPDTGRWLHHPHLHQAARVLMVVHKK